jgi:hypothetical protein
LGGSGDFQTKAPPADDRRDDNRVSVAGKISIFVGSGEGCSWNNAVVGVLEHVVAIVVAVRVRSLHLRKIVEVSAGSLDGIQATIQGDVQGISNIEGDHSAIVTGFWVHVLLPKKLAASASRLSWEPAG